MQTTQDKQEPFKIDLSFPLAEFDRHLDLENNQRIIFSGPFGSGKTYFLNDYFERRKDRFSVIRLAPVNYSVAQNEDIFELIKFDILFHLLSEELFPENLDLPKDFILKHLALLDPEKGIKGILEKANQTGADTLSLLKKLGKVSSGTTPLKADLDSPAGIKELSVFLEKITRETTGIYEQNILTQLLYFLIKEVGANDKEVALIIDDLDRIDPEHIFRILNVFAAHFDLDSRENKFGFHRVILVCDLNNVRRVFANKYGQDVDFSGYIDKFYSRDVFCFDNTPAIIEALNGVLNTIKVFLPDGQPAASSIFPINTEGTSRTLIVFILKAFLRVNSVNLRSILKLRGSHYYLKSKQISKGLKSSQLPIVWILELIRMFLGHGVSLKFGLQKCISEQMGFEEFEVDDEYNHYKLGLIVPALLIPNKMRYEGPYTSKDGTKIDYKIQKEQFVMESVIFQSTITEPMHPIDIFPPLLDAVEILQRKGHLI